MPPTELKSQCNRAASALRWVSGMCRSAPPLLSDRKCVRRAGVPRSAVGVRQRDRHTEVF